MGRNQAGCQRFCQTGKSRRNLVGAAAASFSRAAQPFFCLQPLFAFIRVHSRLVCGRHVCQTRVLTCKLNGMPELPDILTYIKALESRIVGERLIRVRIASTFLLRSAHPPIKTVEGLLVNEVRRIGKRIAIGIEDDLWLVLHLMIAGRLHWRAPEAKLAGRQSLAAFDFLHGSLVLTEAGTKHRASLHVFSGEESLRSLDPGGIDVFSSDLNSFRAALTAENHTLKKALTDPRLVSGIGNADSDEILHAAQLSPLTLTQRLKPHDREGLFTPAC